MHVNKCMDVVPDVNFTISFNLSHTMVYKWCVVPQCTNTTISTPHKLFVSVPTNPKKRKIWLQLAQRDPKSIVAHSNVFMCEDHFDLKYDDESTDFAVLSGNLGSETLKAIDGSPWILMEKDTTNLMQYKMGFSLKLLLSDDAMPTKFQCQDNSKKLTNTGPKGLHKKQKNDHFQNGSPSKTSGESFQYNVEIKQEVIEPEEMTNQDKKAITTQEKSVQVTTTVNNHFGSNTAHRNHLNNMQNSFIENSKSDVDVSSFTSDHLSPFEATFTKKDIDFNKDIETLQNAKNTLRLIDKDPFKHVGVPNECYTLIIQLLQKHTNLKIEQILLCLTKIRLNNTFCELKDHFGISLAEASAIFLENIPILSRFLRKFIVDLDKRNINDINCIIDCLEIDIEAPLDTFFQEMTWSYRKSHTVKYLISCTSVGLINYVSQGFGGKISDVTIVENCNFLNKLQQGTCILADRGFKYIEKVLQEKSMKLIRPPRINGEGKLSETDIRLMKVTANLRIYIEKVFSSIREFSMLKQNSFIDTSISCVLDDIIIIACALVNLQSPIK